MKHYHTLALRELFAQKMTSFLILTAIVLSTMMTAAVGQSAGVLAAMREQQAIAIGGDRYATFVQLTEEQAQFLEQDPRLSYAGRFVPLGDMELNDQLSLDLAEYWGDGLKTRPTYTRLVEGRLPEGPMELALPEDALQFLGFSGEIDDTIRLSCSKALRHGIVLDTYDYTAEFTLVGVTESNFLGYTGGHILGLAGEGTAAELLPDDYLYYSVDIRTTDKKGFQTVMDDLCAQMKIHELDTLYNIPLLNALGIRYDTEAAGSELAMMDDIGFSWLLAVGILVVALILLAAGLVIYNILKIAVSQRVRQYGALRAIGAEKGQLYTVVSVEILLPQLEPQRNGDARPGNYGTGEGEQQLEPYLDPQQRTARHGSLPQNPEVLPLQADGRGSDRTGTQAEADHSRRHGQQGEIFHTNKGKQLLPHHQGRRSGGQQHNQAKAGIPEVHGRAKEPLVP